MTGAHFWFKRNHRAPARVKRARTAGIARVQRAVKKDEARAAPPPPVAARSRPRDQQAVNLQQTPSATPKSPRRLAEREILTKTVTVNDSSVTLYSFDGKSWAGAVRDLIEYKERVAGEFLRAGSIFQ